ncbi:MAG TPA: hypothetical protein VGN12_04430 [Pirellulales bacterium]|jgi:hypothetical protein
MKNRENTRSSLANDHCQSSPPEPDTARGQLFGKQNETQARWGQQRETGNSSSILADAAG